MRDRLQWDVDGRDWPNRAWSRFVTVGQVRWHVQVSPGARDTVLLVHGTGASTHSWRGLARLLAKHYRVVAMDLPGHGFSAGLPAGQASLPAIARELRALLEHLGLEPGLAVGHSAGAAIVVRMVLDGAIEPRSDRQPERCAAAAAGTPRRRFFRPSRSCWPPTRSPRDSLRGVRRIRRRSDAWWRVRVRRSTMREWGFTRD